MFGTSVNSDHDSDCKAARQDCLLKNTNKQEKNKTKSHTKKPRLTKGTRTVKQHQNKHKHHSCLNP